MKFNYPIGRLEGVPPTDESRFGMNVLWLDVEKKRLVATDGHCMVIANVEPDKGETTGAIPVEAFKRYRELCNKAKWSQGRGIEILARGGVVEVFGTDGTITQYKRPDVTFANYTTIMDRINFSDDRQPTIALDYSLLKKVVDALGDANGTGAPKSVVLFVDKFNEAFLVKTSTDGPIAIQMPVKVAESGWKLSLHAVESVNGVVKKPALPAAPKRKRLKAASQIPPSDEVENGVVAPPDHEPETPEPDDEEAARRREGMAVVGEEESQTAVA